MDPKPYTDDDTQLVASTFIAEAKKNPITPGPPWHPQTRMMLGPTEHDIAVAVLDALTAAGWRPPLREPDLDVAGVTQLLVAVKWNGDYYLPSERTDMVRSWIESALDDRDDSPAVTITELPARQG